MDICPFSLCSSLATAISAAFMPVIWAFHVCRSSLSGSPSSSCIFLVFFPCPQLRPHFIFYFSKLCVFLKLQSNFLFWSISPPRYYRHSHFFQKFLFTLLTYSSLTPLKSPFFQSHFFLSVSFCCTLSMWVIVQSCSMLKTWGDCQTDQKTVWTRDTAPLSLSHTHTHTHAHLN